MFASAPTALMFERIVVSGLEMVCTLSSEFLFKKMFFSSLHVKLSQLNVVGKSQAKSTFDDCFFHLSIVEITKDRTQCHNG